MLNRHEIIGRLGKDPDVRYLENGAVVATFSVATSEKFKDKNTGEKREITDWHNVVLWRGLAEVAEKYLRKGDLVRIEGKSKTRSWEQDGIVRYTTELVGSQMLMLGGKSGGNKPPTPGQQDDPFAKSGFVEDAKAEEGEYDDLPF